MIVFENFNPDFSGSTSSSSLDDLEQAKPKTQTIAIIKIYFIQGFRINLSRRQYLQNKHYETIALVLPANLFYWNLTSKIAGSMETYSPFCQSIQLLWSYRRKRYDWYCIVS
jgi:hypothetical protein